MEKIMIVWTAFPIERENVQYEWRCSNISQKLLGYLTYKEIYQKMNNSGLIGNKEILELYSVAHEDDTRTVVQTLSRNLWNNTMRF